MALTKRKSYSATEANLRTGPQMPCFQWAAFALLLFITSASIEASTAMPWEGPMCAVAASLKDQVAVMLSVVATIMIGIMFMYSETGGIVARIGGWLLGLSCALSVASIITALFPGVTIPGCL